MLITLCFLMIVVSKDENHDAKMIGMITIKMSPVKEQDDNRKRIMTKIMMMS